MGLYDSIMVPCPKCGYRNEFQTKSGPCLLNTYQIEDAPDDAMLDVNRHAPTKCHVCDTMYSAPERPTAEDSLRSEVDRLRALVHQACDWLEARTDKQARIFHAAHIRAALKEGK